MDRKQELTSVDLRALVGELGAYEGAKVDKAYLYGDDLLRLKLRDFDRGRIELFVEVGDRKRAHLVAPERVPDAPGRPPSFAKMLRNRLSGADFAGASQYEFDRILELTFDREDGQTTIVAELFGDGNIAVLDGTGEVVDCLETIRLQSRTVAPGSQYAYPDSRVNPIGLSREAFGAHMNDSDTDVVRTLATQLNWGGLYAEELCTRAGVEKTLAIEDADEAVYDALYDAVDELETDLRTGALDPRIYSEDETAVDATPVPLQEYDDLDSEPDETFNAALGEYFYRLGEDDAESSSTDDGPEFDAEIEKQQRIIQQQEGAIEAFEADAEAERERAEALYAHYDLVDEIISTVRAAREDGTDWETIEQRFAAGAERGIEAAEAVADVRPESGHVAITLDGHEVAVDPTEGVEHNADRLYREAKRIEEKKEGALEAIEDTRERLEDLRERKAEWELTDEDGDTDGEDGEDPPDRNWLEEPSIPIRQSEEWYERFRWFHTTDDFLVIGGRDADQNEELVRKYLDPGDRFFHSQAHGGPVTILKATDPSESARDVDIPEPSHQEAAQFAVSYGSVWKDGRFAGDVYAVDHDQVSKTPESGEFLEKGGFAIRGDREYYRDVAVGVAVGITCEPQTRVIGGSPAAITEQAETYVEVEPGRFAQGDVGKRIYRQFRERFADTSFVRKVASPDLIQHFLPPGGSRIVEE
jgi:predicted ribosome quality control (RQC) complex YloA/Tae2 family protein